MLQHEEGDGLLSSAELEIELARLVIALERERPSAEAGEPAKRDFIAWYERTGANILERLAPSLRPLCLERLQQIALSNAGLELTKLELDRPGLKFGPSSDPGATSKSDR